MSSFSFRGNGSRVTTEFTRPADTTAYNVGDVVGPATTGNLSFTGVTVANEGQGYIVYAKVQSDGTSVTPELRLHLFRTPPTAIADNAAFALSYDDREKYLGWIDLGSLESGVSQDNTVRHHIALDRTEAKKLYVILETRTSFTPVSGQKFHIDLGLELQ